MVELISLIVFCILFLIYLHLKKNANKRYANSQVFQIIDREYTKWYSKRKNGFIINKKTTSMFEIDRSIYELKLSVQEQGITSSEVKQYLIFLSDYTPRTFSFKGVVVSILGLLGTNSVLSKIIPNVSDSKWLSRVTLGLTNPSKEMMTGLYLLLFIILMGLTIYIMYAFVNLDSIHKDSQRVFILSRLNDIWDYEVDEDILEIKDILENREENQKIIYTKLKPTKSKFDRDLEEAIGKTVIDNANYVLNMVECINWREFKIWLMGFILPTIFYLLSILFAFWTRDVIINNKDLVLGVIMYFIFVLLVLTFSVLYFSQQDKNEGYNQETSEFKDENYNYNFKFGVRERFRNLVTFLIYIIYIYISRNVSNVIWMDSIRSDELFHISTFMYWEIWTDIPIIIIVVVLLLGYIGKIHKNIKGETT